MVREKQRTMTADRLESDKLDERIASLEQEVARSLTHVLWLTTITSLLTHFKTLFIFIPDCA